MWAKMPMIGDRKIVNHPTITNIKGMLTMALRVAEMIQNHPHPVVLRPPKNWVAPHEGQQICMAPETGSNGGVFPMAGVGWWEGW